MITRREFLYLIWQTILSVLALKFRVFLPIVSTSEQESSDIRVVKGFVFPVTFPFVLGESNVKR